MGFQTVSTVGRVAEVYRAFADGLALGLLSEAGRVRLTTALYSGRGKPLKVELFDWEHEWFVQDLPAAPAKILVGGAGAGRELLWLRGRGYNATGFDPASDSRTSDLLQASYEDLVADGSESLTELQRSGPYDAILLGWGSYTHISSAAARGELLVRLRELSQGPVLLSFWSQDFGKRPGRAKDVGFKLGRLLGDGAPADLSADSVYSHCGYCHRFSKAELRKLAREAGYHIEFRESSTYPHATMFPENRVVCS